MSKGLDEIIYALKLHAQCWIAGPSYSIRLALKLSTAKIGRSSLWLKVYGYISMFFRLFIKGNNFRDFLFACLTDVALPNRGLLSKERICSKRSKFFPLRVSPS